MINCDFHTHTGYSDDCYVSMQNMLEGATDKGVETLAITDHHDPGYLDPEFPFLLDFEAYHKGLEDALTNYAGKLDIRTGLEIGIMEGQFEEANKVVNAYDYDIIIGSFHCLRQDDLYRYDFTDVDGPAMVEDFYTYVLKCLKGYTNYDIVGHLSILDRYIGKLYDYTPYSDIIDEILRTVIDGGKGIEINTSSFKYGTGTWLPRESILKRYHQLGGEILTFGSDAHEPKYYMYHFDDAVELAKSIGFKYYCKFKDRQPEFLTL